MSNPDLFKSDPRDKKIGVVIGKVTDNEDPENIGRVKVKFQSRDNNDESHWARIATNMTGKKYGTYFLPEVGDEVLVAFRKGDIHDPFIVGSLWTGKTKPPEKNQDGKNDIRKIKSRSGHYIEFDDASKGKMVIETKQGHKITLDDKNKKVRVEDKSGQYAEMKDGKKVDVSANKELNVNAPTINITGKKEVNISSNGKVKVSGSKVDISSKGQLNVSSTGLMGIKANGILNIKGSLIRLN